MAAGMDGSYDVDFVSHMIAKRFYLFSGKMFAGMAGVWRGDFIALSVFEEFTFTGLRPLNIF